MSNPVNIQWYHFQADLILTDITFKSVEKPLAQLLRFSWKIFAVPFYGYCMDEETAPFPLYRS